MGEGLLYDTGTGYGVRYDFRVNTLFGLSLLPVVCMRTQVLFTLFVFACE